MIEDEQLDRMIREIVMGTPREESLVPVNDETTKYWNSLTKEIAEIHARGHTVDIAFETPSVDPVDPKMIIDFE